SKAIEKINDDLSLQRMKALAESQRVLELERKLYTNDRHLKLSQSENMKLRVSLDEIKMKYEPDEIAKIRTQKRRREQLPLDCPSEATCSNNAGLPSQTIKVEDLCTAQLAEDDVRSSEPKSVSITGPVDISISSKPEKAINVQLVKERKRVRIMEDQNETPALNERDPKDCPVTSTSSRSVSSPILAQGIQERPTSFFFRFVNYAIRFFLFFLSFAYSVFPPLRLPRLKFLSTFKKP
ncbi:hypothetical protein FKM82_026525, partial [Ascaphus truei]